MGGNMMTKKSPLKPYPNQGEIIRSLAVAMGTKGTNRKIDQYAREGDYDHLLKDRMLKDVIYEPLKNYINKDIASYVQESLDLFLVNYISLVKTIPMDGMSRSESLPVLNYHCFSSASAQMIFRYFDIFGGPQPTLLVASGDSCLNVAFSWIENNLTTWKEFYQNIEKSHKDQIFRWRKGSNFPSLKSLEQLRKWTEGAKSEPKEILSKNDHNRAKTLILLAKTIDHFRKSATGKSAIDNLREHIWSGKTQIDVGKAISTIRTKINMKYRPFNEKALYLESMLRRTEEKKPEANQISRKLLNESRKLEKRYDPDSLTSYFLDFMEGRWFLFSGNHKKALIFYKKAFDKSVYCAGNTQEQIMKECLVLAARHKKRPFLKQLKNQMIAFKWFPGNIDGQAPDINNAKSRSKDHVVEDWEVEQWAAHFNRLFPSVGFFKKQPKTDKKDPDKFGSLMKNIQDKITPDYRHPNRIIKVGVSRKKKMPQLVWFTQINKPKYLEKLLKADASVDVFSENGESPLLMAIEACSPLNYGVSMDESCFKLISAKAHKPKTLNSLSVKRKKVPIISAVETGRSHMVRKLLDMGADVDFRGSTNNQTALNYCLVQMSSIRKPAKNSQINPKRSANLTPQELEAIRRETNGHFGLHLDDQAEAIRKISKLVTAHGHKWVPQTRTSVTIDDMLKITDILLDAGADPNEEHNHVIQGYTPLMLTAEIDEVGLFGKMLDHGGNPENSYTWNGHKINCWDIAINFKSHRVMDLLKTRYPNKIFPGDSLFV